MLESMKVLGFIPESKAIKLYKNADGKVVGERYDKVTYLREFLNFTLEGEGGCYVEAESFLSLLPFISRATIKENYLEVVLKNGAEYKFPYMEVEFGAPKIEPPTLEIKGEIDFSTLKKTALQNLVKPEMRCIYVDNNGAVSCNFLQGTVDRGIISRSPVLLPPDLVDYIPAGHVEIYKGGDMLFYTDTESKFIWSPAGDFMESDEAPWYNSIYEQAMGAQAMEFSPVQEGMEESLKRLSLFGKEAVFNSTKVVVGNSYEPVSIPSARGQVFDLEEVIPVISSAKEMVLSEDGTMFLKNGEVTILVSAKEEE